MSRQQNQSTVTPFDLKLCLISFMAGALFVLPAFLYISYQCRQHVQAETRLCNQLAAEHAIQQTVTSEPQQRIFVGYSNGSNP